MGISGHGAHLSTLHATKYVPFFLFLCENQLRRLTKNREETTQTAKQHKTNYLAAYHLGLYPRLEFFLTLHLQVVVKKAF